MSELWSVSVTSPAGAQVSIGVRADNYHEALEQAGYYEFPELEGDEL